MGDTLFIDCGRQYASIRFFPPLLSSLHSFVSSSPFLRNSTFPLSSPPFSYPPLFPCLSPLPSSSPLLSSPPLLFHSTLLLSSFPVILYLNFSCLILFPLPSSSVSSCLLLLFFFALLEAPLSRVRYSSFLPSCHLCPLLPSFPSSPCLPPLCFSLFYSIFRSPCLLHSSHPFFSSSPILSSFLHSCAPLPLSPGKRMDSGAECDS